MHIKKIKLEKFKRFTELQIDNIPSSSKLVILVGPNGCGKSSLFDSFKTWHLLRGYNRGTDENYCKKDIYDKRNSYDLVNIEFYEDISNLGQEIKRSLFYFRTAYRNSPNITVNSLSKIGSPLNSVDDKMMIQNDATVNENYQRLISKTIEKIYDKKYDDKTIQYLRDDILGKIRSPLSRLFPDLILTEIGMVTEQAEFYFKKGIIEKYGYEKLSGGEKAVFDLLLDIVIKSEYYHDSIFCIDEPETHIHTKLQANLLRELFLLIPDNSQLWIATHSFGMLKEAKKLFNDYPDKVTFINFDGYNFDEPVHLIPTSCDETVWKKMIEISLDDYSSFLAPEIIVFCEGTTKGRKRKDFDARCYANIFKNKYANVMFYSLGSCNDVQEKTLVINFIKNLSPKSRIIRLVDKDDRSPEEILDLKNDGIRVLDRRHIESYILDDEILKKLCETEGKIEQYDNIKMMKKAKISDSINRGNPDDDIKSASNDICTEIKKMLSLKSCGNTPEMIMRDRIAPLFSPDLLVYQELERIIFG